MPGFIFNMHYISDEHYFPPAESANRGGIVAIGGDLSPERLILAYSSGIFPWFNEDEPILWWSPEKRMVLYPNEVVVTRSMKRTINKKMFRATFNQNFREVISACREIYRPGQDGTWITEDMLEAYCKLNEMGIAKSLEVWQDDELVGGIYGIDLGHIFCGESMFSKVPNASKFAFITLAQKLEADNYVFLDCQIYNDHLHRLGAREISRTEFLAELSQSENLNL
jgi:leucyl/phenylalanyl-tRNA--protein transferase